MNNNTQGMQRRIIFIGGVSFSGSTLLDMILANDPTGFSGGELSQLYGQHGFHRPCACGDDACQLWPGLADTPPDKLYDAIFARYPDCRFIVDSSKSPMWIDRRMRALSHRFDIRHVLIYKSPADSAQSFKKRGWLSYWQQHWVDYHRLYTAAVASDWMAINYADLARNPVALERLCAFCDLPFNTDKTAYWNHVCHGIGGNATTRLHLYDENDARFRASANFLRQKCQTSDADIKQQHKSIYYQQADADMVAQLAAWRQHNPWIKRIEQCLSRHHSQPATQASIAINRPELALRRLAYRLKRGQLA